jgi:hypothetical protein
MRDSVDGNDNENLDAISVTVFDASRLAPDEDCHVDAWEESFNLFGVVAYVGCVEPTGIRILSTVY